MWRKIWICDIEGILMMLKGNIPKNEAKENYLRIKPLISRFPHSNLDLDFFGPKFQIKVHKHCETVHCAYAYHYTYYCYIAPGTISVLFNLLIFINLKQLDFTCPGFLQ
jgi:hypothetical protein